MSLAALRARARAIFDAGVAAADPAAAVRRSLEAKPVRAERVIAFGKAAVPMALAALEHCPDAPALVVTNRENVGAALPDGARLLVAGHPVPDEEGEAAALAVETFAQAAGEGETVLVLVSGGGSAMLPAPVGGLTLADKVAVTEALLASGAPIDEINTVRQALSRLKGGGLARAIHPARTVGLLLSDVPHDDVRAIASGPTIPERGTGRRASDALDILKRYVEPRRRPARAVSVLLNGAPGSDPCLQMPGVENRLVGGNGVSLDAMAAAVANDGVVAVVVSRWLDGDVADAAAAMHRAATGAGEGGVALLAGGETTVVLRGGGRGGRNQEMALRFALLAERQPLGRDYVFLSGGTDGRDGPTDAAGGLVDTGTPARMRAAGVDPDALLADNDSHAALAASGDLLSTGGTGTNVADLQVLLLGPKRDAGMDGDGPSDA